MNDLCSICSNDSKEIEIITLDTCNHIICKKCFIPLMDEGRSFHCSCDTWSSNNVIITKKNHENQTAMSYCSYKFIICVESLDNYLGNKLLNQSLNVLIRMKSFNDYREIKLGFTKEIDKLYNNRFPVDNSLQEVLKSYEKKIFMKMNPTFYSKESNMNFNKIRKIINNLRCECDFIEPADLEKKLVVTSKLSEFFHNSNLEYLFLELNPYHLSRRYGYTRFYGQQFFKNYYERYEEDIVKYQNVMYFPTAMLISQIVDNSQHYKSLYPFMFKNSENKCLVCVKNIHESKCGFVESCSHKVCEICIKKYLITKVKCPIDGKERSDIIMQESKITAFNYLKLKPQLFEEPFMKLEEIIYDIRKQIHSIIPKCEIIWMKVSQLFHIADQSQRPKFLHNKNTSCNGKKVKEHLEVVEALCYNIVNDESFFKLSSYSMYYCSFCQTNIDISLNNDGYFSDISNYQRMKETLHMCIYLHHFSMSIYNNFVSDIVVAFQHFETTDKILKDLKEHFNLDRPNHICLQQLKKDMPLLLSQQKYMDILKEIKQSLKKSKYLNHLCRSMMWL